MTVADIEIQRQKILKILSDNTDIDPLNFLILLQLEQILIFKEILHGIKQKL